MWSTYCKFHLVHTVGYTLSLDRGQHPSSDRWQYSYFSGGPRYLSAPNIVSPCKWGFLLTRAIVITWRPTIRAVQYELLNFWCMDIPIMYGQHLFHLTIPPECFTAVSIRVKLRPSAWWIANYFVLLQWNLPPPMDVIALVKRRSSFGKRGFSGRKSI